MAYIPGEFMEKWRRRLSERMVEKVEREILESTETTCAERIRQIIEKSEDLKGDCIIKGTLEHFTVGGEDFTDALTPWTSDPTPPEHQYCRCELPEKKQDWTEELFQAIEAGLD